MDGILEGCLVTLLSLIVAVFPFLHAAASFGLFVAAFFSATNRAGSALLLVFACLVLYLAPPLIYRVHACFFPLREGFSNLSEKKYSPWWGSHQIQGLYTSLPFLEALLRTVPGLYSSWLRLWGARIGKGVYWTPRVEIIDRPLLEVGDRAVIGHEAVFCSHVVTRSRGKVRLYVAKISLGEDCLIGAHAKVGPGVQIAANVEIPYGTECWINQKFR